MATGKRIRATCVLSRFNSCLLVCFFPSTLNTFLSLRAVTDVSMLDVEVISSEIDRCLLRFRLVCMCGFSDVVQGVQIPVWLAARCILLATGLCPFPLVSRSRYGRHGVVCIFEFSSRLLAVKLSVADLWVVEM